MVCSGEEGEGVDEQTLTAATRGQNEGALWRCRLARAGVMSREGGARPGQFLWSE